MLIKRIETVFCYLHVAQSFFKYFWIVGGWTRSTHFFSPEVFIVPGKCKPILILSGKKSLQSLYFAAADKFAFRVIGVEGFLEFCCMLHCYKNALNIAVFFCIVNFYFFMLSEVVE